MTILETLSFFRTISLRLFKEEHLNEFGLDCKREDQIVRLVLGHLINTPQLHKDFIDEMESKGKIDVARNDSTAFYIRNKFYPDDAVDALAKVLNVGTHRNWREHFGLGGERKRYGGCM